MKHGGGTYPEMQACLNASFALLGPECQLFTRAAAACDFAAVREACPGVEADAPQTAAACVLRVAREHERGARKVSRAFLNFSHTDCATALGRLPDQRSPLDHAAARVGGSGSVRTGGASGGGGKAGSAVDDDDDGHDDEAAAAAARPQVITAAAFAALRAAEEAEAAARDADTRAWASHLSEGGGQAGGADPFGEHEI